MRTHTAASAHSSGTSTQAPTRTQQRHQRPSSRTHTAAAHSSSTQQRRQRPSSHAHTTVARSSHQHPSSRTHTAAAHSSGTIAQARTGTQQRHPTARKRTHASLPILEVRTPEHRPDQPAAVRKVQYKCRSYGCTGRFHRCLHLYLNTWIYTPMCKHLYLRRCVVAVAPFACVHLHDDDDDDDDEGHAQRSWPMPSVDDLFP